MFASVRRRVGIGVGGGGGGGAGGGDGAGGLCSDTGDLDHVLDEHGGDTNRSYERMEYQFPEMKIRDEYEDDDNDDDYVSEAGRQMEARAPQRKKATTTRKRKTRGAAGAGAAAAGGLQANPNWSNGAHQSYSNADLEGGGGGGDGANGEPSIQSRKKPCRFKTYDWDAVDLTEEPTDNPSYCFFCDCTTTQQQNEDDSPYNQLLEFLQASYINIHPLVYTSKAQLFYNSFLRDDTDDKLPWRQRIIYEHIHEHAPVLQTMIEEPLRTLNDVLRITRDNGLFERENDWDPPSVNHDQLYLYLKVLKERKVLIIQAERFRQRSK